MHAGTDAEQLLVDGKLNEAEQLCRHTLAIDPFHAPSLNILGIVLRNRGSLAASIAAHRSAASLSPGISQFRNNLGVALTSGGHFEQAVEAFFDAIQLAPDDPELHGNVSVALMALRRFDQARVALAHAVKLNPDSFRHHYNLGNVLQELGDVNAAVQAYAQSIQLNPACAEAWCNLGVALRRRGDDEQAIAVYRRAIELMPESAEAYSNLGAALADAGRLREAIEAYGRSIALSPTAAATHFNLANALALSAQLQPALDSYEHAIRLQPSLIGAHCNRGNTLMRMGRREEAMREYEISLQLDPASADAHWNRALALLIEGKNAEGWEEYEWRNRLIPPSSQQFPHPQWNGEALNGQTILLHAEAGLGDTVQFVRYATAVRARGGRVLLQVQPELMELLKHLDGVDELIPRGNILPPFDVQCPLMSLPRAFGIRVDSVPADVPYLHPDVKRVDIWRERLGDAQGLKRIGIAWAGRPAHQYDAQRSMQLSMFEPLGRITGVEFISLQKGDAAAQLASSPLPIRDFTMFLDDYADTAALMTHLDGVIAVDTSVAHVAAALGKPVWLLLAFAPDWRWLLDRSDSPWYPSMRLFRQTKIDDWAGVIERVVYSFGEFLPLNFAAEGR